MLALLFALATSAYSVAGRAVWQHTPSMLLLTIVIYMLLRAREQQPASIAGGLGGIAGRALLHGAADGCVVRRRLYSVCSRPASAISRSTILLAAAPVAAAFIAYDLSVYHTLFSPYYRSDLIGFYPQNWSQDGAWRWPEI